MGSSIWLVVIVPFVIVYTIVGGIKGAIFGYPTAELSLPYDEASGAVWEYDCVDDPYIELVETKVEGDEQIFVFVGCDCEDEEKYQGLTMYLVFTDKNGNEKAFYGQHSGKLNAPTFYPEEECSTVDFTLTAKKPKKNGTWEIGGNSHFILINEPINGESTTFTAVITPDSNRPSFTVDYVYTLSLIHI